MSQGGGGVTNGMTRAEITARLGPPNGFLAKGSDEILFFSSGTATLRAGKLLAYEPSSGPSDGDQRPKAETAQPPVQLPPPSPAPQPQQPVATEKASDVPWQTDFAQAKAEAVQAHSYLLLDFTGSDWCHFCIKLDQEVLSKPEFNAYVANKFVCVKLDYLRKHPQSDQLKKQTQDLAHTFAVRGYPTLILLAPNGDLVGSQVGYRGDGPQKFIEKLQSLVTEYERQHPGL